MLYICTPEIEIEIDMEKQLKIYKGVVIVSVGISVASLAFVLFKTLL
jgi:hypothetical protein